MTARPKDPRANVLCSACNVKRDGTSTPHCENSRCGWWRCGPCKAVNDETGANNKTLRDGSPRRPA